MSRVDALGLVPWWATGPAIGSKMINARARRSLTSKAEFKDAFKRRRCLVIPDRFYEWLKQGSQKTPMLIRLRSDNRLDSPVSSRLGDRQRRNHSRRAQTSPRGRMNYRGNTRTDASTARLMTIDDSSTCSYLMPLKTWKHWPVRVW